MTENQLADREHRPLSRLRETLVRGLLENAERLEVHPHGVRGIGEASVSEGISGEQVAEFVVNDGFGDRFDGQDGEAKSQGK